MYMDIRRIDTVSSNDNVYLKLVNRRDSLPYKMEDNYIVGDELTLGRNSNNQIVIKDPYISKKHLKIVGDEGGYFLKDLDSINGRYVNEERIQDVGKLSNNDIIKVGNIEFLFVNRGYVITYV